MKTARLFFLVLVLFLFGCACAQARSESEMNELASALTKMSRAAESAVHNENMGLDLRDMALLTLATEHDPGLMDPFQGYVLRARPQSGHAAVLVCTSDGKTALLEDAGCTARMEQHHWKARPPLPCTFTLDLSVICKK